MAKKRFRARRKREIQPPGKNATCFADANRKPEPSIDTKQHSTPSSRTNPPGANATGSIVSHRQRLDDLGQHNMDANRRLTTPPSTPSSEVHHADDVFFPLAALAAAAAAAAADSTEARGQGSGYHAHFASPVKRELSQDFMDGDFGEEDDDNAYTFPRDQSGQPLPTRWMDQRLPCVDEVLTPVIIGPKDGEGRVAGGSGAIGGVQGRGVALPTLLPDNGVIERRILNPKGRDNDNFCTPRRDTDFEGFPYASPMMPIFPTSTDKQQRQTNSPPTTENDLALADWCGGNGSTLNQQPKQYEPSPISDSLEGGSGFGPDVSCEVLQKTLFLSPNDQTTMVYSEIFSPVDTSNALPFPSSLPRDQPQGIVGTPTNPLFLTTTSSTMDTVYRVSEGAYCPPESAPSDDQKLDGVQPSLADVMGDLWAAESNMDTDNADDRFFEELVPNTRPEIDLADPSNSVESGITGVGVEYNCDNYWDVSGDRQTSSINSALQRVGFSISTSSGTSGGTKGEFGSSYSSNTTWVLSPTSGQRTLYPPTAHEGGEPGGRPTLMTVTPPTPRPSHHGAPYASPLSEWSLSELLLLK